MTDCERTSRIEPVDGPARVRAVEAPGSVLVQAPAGSGKTTLLAQRYLQLLATVNAPESILALTFTRRAAEEMRERIIRALGAASFAECPTEENFATWTKAVAARRHLRSIGIDVERAPSRLRIETIDSFNAWLAAQLPITSGAGGRLRLVENARPLYESAARRALAYDAHDSFGAAVEQLLAIGDQRWRQLGDLIADMLPSRDRWLPLLAGRLKAASALDEAQLLRVRRHFDEDLELLVTRVLRGALEALGGERVAHLSAHLSAAARRLGAERADLEAWRIRGTPLEADLPDLERWRTAAELLLTAGGTLRKRLTKSDGFPPECPERQPLNELLAEFEQRPHVQRALKAVKGLPAPQYDDEDWSRVRNAAQVLVLAAAELEQVFREQGHVDFPAVSMAALRSLGCAEAPTDLALKLDYRLQHLLLDEFQDTSSAQLELVRLLTAGWQRGDGRSVFCVGDPMQSIYGFRQAEVRAFLELAEQGIGEVEFAVERLTSNFRSDRVLIDWVNARFAAVMPRTDDRERGAIAFRPSESGLPPSAGGAAAVSVRGFTTPEAEALAIADWVEASRREHPDWRIAILVRARTHARPIAAAFRARGVSFRAVDIEPLQDRPAVRDLVMLTCALTHLGDRAAWLAVLRAPWTGLLLGDLLNIARGGPTIWESICDDTVLARLSEDGRARCRRLRALLEAAFRVRSETTLTRWVERTWLALGGAGSAVDERDLEHARTVFARLRELEEQGPPDAADFVRSFAYLYAEGGASDAVEIMTIHKSKGLEFDAVIIPALNRPIRANRGQLLFIHSFAREGRDGMVMAARPPIGAGPDRLFEFLRSQAKDAASLEAERLLYVACTRAKRQLHLTATFELRDEEDEVPPDPAEAASAADEPAIKCKANAGSLLAVLWPTVARDFSASLTAQVRQGRGAQTPAELKGGPLRRVPSDWCWATDAASSLAGKELSSPGADTPVFDWVGETARRVGSLVHAELEGLDLERTSEAAIRARAPHFERWLALAGVPEERLSEAGERAVAALLAVLRDPHAQWIFRKGYREDLREHAVSGHWRGEVVRAVFDRSFIDEHGIRWIIDYKTSQHSGGGRDEFLAREVERYRPQLERYALLARRMGPEPVRVGLYFPLMAAWREWEPPASAS